MLPSRFHRCIALPIAILLGLPAVAHADGAAPIGWIEAGGKYYNLTNGQPDTSGGYLRGVYGLGGTDVLSGEIVGLRRFDDTGTYFSVADTHTFSDRWYGNLTLGSSVDGFFWPEFRLDASATHKWGSRREILGTLGYGYIDYKDGSRDHTLRLEGSYYFESPIIVQAGIAIGHSLPGSQLAPSGYAAVTWGRARSRYVTLRGAVGHQAYEPIAPGSPAVDFPFDQVTLTWREWLGRDWGFNLVTEHYGSDPYDHIGVELGLFRDF